MGGARDCAGRVKAKKAAGGFDGGLARRHARRNFREIFFVLLGRKLGSRLAQRHELAVVPLGWKRDAILALADWGERQGIREGVENWTTVLAGLSKSKSLFLLLSECDEIAARLHSADAPVYFRRSFRHQRRYLGYFFDGETLMRNLFCGWLR